MSFKKQQPYQPDMFKVPLLPSRPQKYHYDPKASHNQFYHNVYSEAPVSKFFYCHVELFFGKVDADCDFLHSIALH